jgi:uncharacterized membrane protein
MNAKLDRPIVAVPAFIAANCAAVYGVKYAMEHGASGLDIFHYGFAAFISTLAVIAVVGIVGAIRENNANR